MALVKEFEHCGFRCVITKNDRMGFLCGYVGLPPEHPFHGKDYDDCHSIDVHGGWTYGADGVSCIDRDEKWYLGFDCAHAGDLIPSMENDTIGHEVYRDEIFVTNELKSAAEQLQKVSL